MKADANRCQTLLHTLYQYSLKPEFKRDRQMARELYFISTGKINDDDPNFEQRMACFQEFFLFDYRLSEGFSGASIFETFLYNAQSSFSLEEINEYEELRSFKQSLYQVEAHKGEKLIVIDLLSGKDYLAFSLPEYSFVGFDVKQIFDGRRISFKGQNYFTGAFILHSKHVRFVIEKFVREFLKNKICSKAQYAISWQEELNSRNNLLKTITEQKLQIQQAEKKKAVDLLNVTKKIAEIPKKISSPNLIMALGKNEYVSPFVPETPFYDTLSLLHRFAYSEIRSMRYKHIDAVKIYQNGVDKNLNVPGIPKIEKVKVEEDVERFGTESA